MKQGIYARQKQADALDAYLSSQTRKLQLLERFVEQGGSLSDELRQVVERFENDGMMAYEQMLRGQKLLLSQLTQGQTAVAKETANPWANPVIDSIDLDDPETIKRRQVQIVPCEATPRGESALPKSGIILMLGDEDAYGKALKQYLQDHGLTINGFRRSREQL